MATTTRTRAAWHLRKLGWRITPGARLTQAIKDFQRGYARTHLAIDGVPGPKTMAAILESSSFRSATKKGGTLSPNFDWTEFRCRCGQRFASCRSIWISRDLVLGVEEMRSKFYPRGLSVVSGCRCEAYNRTIPGAAVKSQHSQGNACDVMPAATVPAVRALGLFGGVGYAKSNGRVCHVDVRPGSRSNPASWVYSQW